MPEVIECPECQRKLSMREEFLGQDVKCPSCGATFVAAVARRPAPPPPPPPAPVPERPARDYDRRRDREDDRPRRRDRDDFDRDRGVRPDRGAAVLTLGILGLVFCCIPTLGWILGGIALGMGSSDLGEMSRGRMDRAGEGATQGGKICGLIAIILNTLALFLWCMAWYQDRHAFWY